MGLLKTLTKLSLDIATTPVALVKDLVTFGGINVDKADPYTKDKLDQIAEDWEVLRELLND